jgi:hypothetical protein
MVVWNQISMSPWLSARKETPVQTGAQKLKGLHFVLCSHDFCGWEAVGIGIEKD